MDRWASETRRRDQLQDPVHAATAREHLERDQHQARSTVEEAKENAASGLESVCRAPRIQVWHLFVRTANGGVARAIRKDAKEKQNGLGFLPSAAAIVLQDDELVHREREKGRDPISATQETNFRFRERKTALESDQSLPNNSSSTPRRTSSTRIGAAKKL